MRVPNFFCPHCERFKKWFQIETWEYTSKFYCKHCGSVLIDTEELFLDIVKQICAKRGEKEGEPQKNGENAKH